MKLSTFIWLFFIGGIVFFVFDGMNTSGAPKPTWQDYAICAGQMKYEDKRYEPTLIKAYQYDVELEEANKLMVSTYEELRTKKDRALSQQYFIHCEKVTSYEKVD